MLAGEGGESQTAVEFSAAGMADDRSEAPLHLNRHGLLDLMIALLLAVIVETAREEVH
jgi:hypothetical protein